MVRTRIFAVLPVILACPAFAAEAPKVVPAAGQTKPITVSANKDAVTPWSGEKIVCTREAPIGSLIAVRRCTTKSNDEQNARNARDVLTRPGNYDFER